jgi:predicted nuclease with TOPRIM domain
MNQILDVYLNHPELFAELVALELENAKLRAELEVLTNKVNSYKVLLDCKQKFQEKMDEI